MSSTNHNPAQAAPVPEPSTGIPDWVFTVHPRELAFYDHKIEDLHNINVGISAIARTLLQAQHHDEFDESLHGLDGNIRDGLLRAIDVLAHAAFDAIEFMQERIKQYAPEQAAIQRD